MHFDVSRGKLNGIFCFLYKKYSSDYRNIVKVNGTGETYIKNVRDSIGTVIPDTNLYFVSTGNNYNVYLLKHYVHIVHYSIKQNLHTARILTQWKLQGSLDGSKWKTLSEVNDCDEECKTESIHSYPSREGIFNAFRVLKYNTNSDGQVAYDLHKFELFGSVCLTKDCRVPVRMYHTKCYLKNHEIPVIYFVMLII